MQIPSVDYRNQYPDISCGNLTCYGPFTAKCDLNDSRPCRCLVGFMGNTCREDENECTKGYPCINRGHCINTIGSFSCNCLRGWAGDHCQLETGDPQECMPGWTLPRCTHDLDECLNTSLYTCAENQHCRNTRGNYTCECNAGWKSIGCLEDIDECESYICKNNGTCVNTRGSFICQCQDGWRGYDCAADVDECMTSSCKNNGSCINTNGSFSCQCEHGWDGYSCADDVNECSASPCNSNETCINTNGSFRCQLYENYDHRDETVADFIYKLNLTDKDVGVVPADERIYNETNATSGSLENKDKSLPKENIGIAMISAGSALGTITLLVGIRIAYITFKKRRVAPTNA
ncbi:neurogenic locus notch homolog protein 2-like [Dreissena polymorpha]|nr:neurogenic locus notch homolog protein 2-like [Dreissena polymorpha]